MPAKCALLRRGAEKRMFGGCALKASCRAEEWSAFSGSVCARHSREPHGVSSNLFPAQIKRAPASGTPSIWRREEDVRRLRLESVVPRGRLDRILRLGVRASLARTSGKCRISQSLPRANKKSASKRHSFYLAQRRGFEPPDESPPSHDFQSCSLNHSDISAEPCNHIIFPQKRQLILRAFRQKVFGNFLFSSLHAARKEKRGKHALKRVKSCKKAEEFDIRLRRCMLSCYQLREGSMKKEIFPHLLTAFFRWCKIEGRGQQDLPCRQILKINRRKPLCKTFPK